MNTSFQVWASHPDGKEEYLQSCDTRQQAVWTAITESRKIDGYCFIRAASQAMST
ncbi:MAG: hypothetical protein VKL39_11320 [Leptolyngbyaceae bacterium]|nr:hypothetical protein [Leptolyngbyaceae bacterium]